MDTIILAIDIGTSGVKASLVREDLSVAADETAEYQTYFPFPGAAEHEAEDWWLAARRAVRAIAERHPEEAFRISAIGLSGHMLGLLPLDRAGVPLRRSLIHADTRSVAEEETLRQLIGPETLYRVSGNVLSASSPLCKMLWLKNHETDLYARTACFLQAKDYLAMKLTGGVMGSDYSDASHCMWLDLTTRRYADTILRTLGLDREKLPPLRKSHETVGVLCQKAAENLGLKAGIPVTAGGGDGSCASAGAGLSQEGDLYCSLGTTAWMARNADQQFIDSEQRVYNIMALDGEHFGVFGAMQSAGRAVDWARRLFALPDFKSFDALAARANPGCDGLVFLPYLEGERSPIFDTQARSVFFGADIGHGQEDFLRAVLEGVAFALRSILLALLHDNGKGDTESQLSAPLRIIGGGSKSVLWKRILADICRQDLYALTVPASAVTSLGAAIAAGVGIGLYGSYREAAEKIRLGEKCAYNPETAEAYTQSWRRFKALYPALREIYRL